MAEILFVTWDGGGNVPPATAIAAELRRRGHRVRFVGHTSQRAPLEAQGFEVEPTTHARPFAADDPQSVLAMIRMFGDRGLGAIWSTLSPASFAQRTYSSPSAIVKASSSTASAPASCMWYPEMEIELYFGMLAAV